MLWKVFFLHDKSSCLCLLDISSILYNSCNFDSYTGRKSHTVEIVELVLHDFSLAILSLFMVEVV